LGFLLDSATLTKVGTCLVGNGDLLSQVGGGAKDALTNVTQSFNTLNSFDTAAISTNLTALMTELINTV
jgi:hypothetical protein